MTIMTTTAAAASNQAASQQQTSITTAAPSGKIAVVKEILSADKEGQPTFTCIVDGAVVGTSKHKDYFEFHKRRGDIVRLNELPISKFVYVDANEQILETKNLIGVSPARASVARAITMAKTPHPAPLGFNNQTRAQAQENGRKGAQARLKNSNDRPVAATNDAVTDALEKAREFGRLGAKRAAENRVLKETVSTDIIKRGPGRPRKDRLVS